MSNDQKFGKREVGKTAPKVPERSGSDVIKKNMGGADGPDCLRSRPLPPLPARGSPFPGPTGFGRRPFDRRLIERERYLAASGLGDEINELLDQHFDPAPRGPKSRGDTPEGASKKHKMEREVGTDLLGTARQSAIEELIKELHGGPGEKMAPRPRPKMTDVLVSDAPNAVASSPQGGETSQEAIRKFLGRLGFGGPSASSKKDTKKE